jgi:hypothetical protein
MSDRLKRYVCALGVFLVLVGLYVVTNVGRMDVGDGLSRHDVARSWLDRGHPQLTDSWVKLYWGVENPKSGVTYSMYNAAGSLTPIPLMVASRALPGHTTERERFAFTMISPIAGAVGAALLLVGYGTLGVRLRTALLCTGLFALTSLWWPGSLTVFDQTQHGILIFASLLIAWQSGRRGSLKLAVLGGVVGGLVLNYQEFYALVLPAIALAVFSGPVEGSGVEGLTLKREPGRDAVMRYFGFAAGCLVGLGLFFAYNYLRFGTLFAVQRYKEWPTGDVVEAFVSLLLSPGKGIFLFSPLLVLAILGARSFYGRAPALAAAIGIASVIYLGVIATQPFYGGDPCWGPRYTIVVMPLWALAIPYGIARLRKPALVVGSLAAAGLAVQLLGVSLDPQPFYEKRLDTVFLSGRRWVHFRHSMLLARPRELQEAVGLSSGQPYYAAISYRGATYPTLHPSDFDHRGQAKKSYTILDLPRPWPFWINRIPPEHRPVELGGLLLLCAAVAGSGLLLLGASLAGVRAANRAPDPVFQPS